MSKFRNSRYLRTIIPDKFKVGKQLPSLPDELWLPILTTALEPELIVDPFCFYSNMEKFHYTLTSPKSTTSAKTASNSAHRMRRSLSLVCRRFYRIMHSIPFAIGLRWLHEVDNEPYTYRAPVVRWRCAPGAYGRLDVKMIFEHEHNVDIRCQASAFTYRLFIKREKTQIDTFALIRSFTSLVPQHGTTRVIHLGLEHCKPAPHAYDPMDLTKSGAWFTGLSTLSLSLGANGIRGVFDLTLEFPVLRNLFLKFPPFGLDDSALSEWRLPALTLCSLHCVIGAFGVQPIPALPRFLVSLLTKYGSQLDGLRLVPGPWGFRYKDQKVLPMDINQQYFFWKEFTNLKALSTDLTYLQKHLDSTTLEARTQICEVFSRLERLTHVESRAFALKLAGIEAALSYCGPQLETLSIVSRDGEKTGKSWSDLPQFVHLEGMCSARAIQLLDVHGNRLSQFL